MTKINFRRTYRIDDCYEAIKSRSQQFLGKYRYFETLYEFNDQSKDVTFVSERLFPQISKQRIRILLLFSNPHPHSVHQGMFLSPATQGQESLFWPTMRESGLLPIESSNRSPESLARICLEVNYDGPFEFLFYCYYAFPTDYPDHIKKIFGKTYFEEQIEPEAASEFIKIIQENKVLKVLTFNKSIFNLVSEKPVEKYINRLKEGEVIQSRLRQVNGEIPIFLTFPTGWRYAKNFKEIRVESLKKIRQILIGG